MPWWLPEDKRSVAAQVKSGLRKGIGIVGGTLVAGIALFGFIALRSAHTASDPLIPYLKGPYRPLIAICFAAVIMFVTAQFWAGYTPGFVFVPGLITAMHRATSLAPINRDSLFAARVEYLELAVYYVAVIVLLWRYIPSYKRNVWKWRHVGIMDRAALTIFALTFFFAWAVQAVNPGRLHMRPFFGSLVPLVLIWLMRRLHPTHDSPGTTENA